MNRGTEHSQEQRPGRIAIPRWTRFRAPRLLLRLAIPLLACAPGRLEAADIDWQNAHKERKITAVRVPEGRIVIDGELEEPEWQSAQPATDFIQTEPRTGEVSTERTEVRLLYDDRNLYVGVNCFDSEGARGIVVTELNKDYVPFENDVFTILLDTFDDDRNAFMFGTNPRGAKREGQIGGDGTMSNFDWDGIWYVKTRINEQGWEVEMAIPFRTLRFRNLETHLWGVNFLRRIRRKNEDTHWSPIPRHYRLNRASLAGTLEGISGIRQGRNLYVKPYLVAPIARRQDDDIDFKPELGLDVKYGVTPGLTLDLTANTDFSQVEADEEQVNLTRFSLFFPEKREFFLENSSIFAFGRSSRLGERGGTRRDLIPFFSRRIGISQGRLVPILGGARLTGRVGRYTLGALSMQADKFEETPATNFAVGRLRRDIFRNSDVGAIFINKRASGGNFNRTYGLDANLKFFNYLDISSFVLQTDTPGVGSKSGAGDLSVGWTDRLWDLGFEYLSIQENFNPEVGFVPRKGIRKSVAEFGLTPRPGERMPWVREFKPSVFVEYITDQENRLETRNVQSAFSTVFHNSSALTFSRNASFERLAKPFEIRAGQNVPPGDYQFEEFSLSFSSDRRRMFSGNLKAATGDFYDGEKNSYTSGIRFQPSYRFRSGLSWSYNDINLPSGAFTTNLVTTRVEYAFSTTMFLKALIQYNSTLREISSNIRFNFIYRPLSDLFLVYNERRSSTGAVVERALIAKFTYVFDF